VRSGCKEKAAQRGIQSAGGDGGAFRGENPDRAVGRVWGSPDDDQQLEAGAGEACGGAVWARQQGAGGRGCAEGDRRSWSRRQGIRSKTSRRPGMPSRISSKACRENCANRACATSTVSVSKSRPTAPIPTGRSTLPRWSFYPLARARDSACRRGPPCCALARSRHTFDLSKMVPSLRGLRAGFYNKPGVPSRSSTTRSPFVQDGPPAVES
jgi:hypothetical protein